LFKNSSGYFEKTTFVKDIQKAATSGEINFYDSNTGKLLFTAPKGRTLEDFLIESRAHGWPSFRGMFCVQGFLDKKKIGSFVLFSFFFCTHVLFAFSFSIPPNIHIYPCTLL
jgi:hypothetical protein